MASPSAGSSPRPPGFIATAVTSMITTSMSSGGGQGHGNSNGVAYTAFGSNEPYSTMAAAKQAHETHHLIAHDSVRLNGGAAAVSGGLPQALPETTLRGPGRGSISSDAQNSLPPPPTSHSSHSPQRATMTASAATLASTVSSPATISGRGGGGLLRQNPSSREPFTDTATTNSDGTAGPVSSLPASAAVAQQQQQQHQQPYHVDPSAGFSGPAAVPGPSRLSAPPAPLQQPSSSSATAAMRVPQRGHQGSHEGPETTLATRGERLDAAPAAPPAEQLVAAVPPPPAVATATTAPSSAAAGASGAAATRSGSAGATDRSTMFARPAKALSGQLVALYKAINARYCNQRRLATPGPKYNRGFDDKEGHYIVLPGEEILERYTVQEALGKGSFGTVVRCYDEKRREAVALKITRHGSNFRSQAKLELDILLKLNSNPNLAHLVVKLLKVFDWQGHLVLVFELLSFNLYQLIKCTRYSGVSLELVRKFAYQLICTLLLLEQQRPQPIIHCDIKPENILLRNQNRSGIRLIDFGSACYADRCVHKYIQSRFYRCPEVILCLGYTTAIDRWSLGCVLVELHTGMPLFDGRTEAAQLARFECTLGPVPSDMVAASSKSSKFYTQGDSGFVLRDALLPRRSLESVLGVTTGGPRGSRRGTAGHDEASYREFLDFTAQLLRYRPEERISCQDALRHPFLAPLYLSDQQQRHARRQQQQQMQAQQDNQSQQQP